MSEDVAAVLAGGIRYAIARGMSMADGALYALTKAGYAVVKVPEPVGWAADAFTRQTELDEYGYFSVNGVQDRDHPIPLYVIMEAP